MLSRLLRGPVLAAGLWASTTGCATVWGIDEGADLPDGAADTATDLRRDAGDLDARGSADSAIDPDVGQPMGTPCGPASTCIPQLPVGGWEGPYAIVEGSGATALPDCPANTYPRRVYDGMGSPSAPPATCTCACGSPSGGVCAPPSLTYVTKNGCGACSPAVPPSSLDGGCAPLAFPGGPCAVASIGTSAAIGGSCTPAATTTIAPATWTTVTRLCAPASPPSSAACAAGQICVPTTALPVASNTYCIAIAAQVACPLDYFTVPRLTFRDAQDTRGCSPCTCGPRINGDCAGTVVAYNDTACTQSRGTVTLPVTCSSFGGARALSYDGGAPSGGSCVPDGGQPTGGFVPTTPYTICCDK